LECAQRMRDANRVMSALVPFGGGQAGKADKHARPHLAVDRPAKRISMLAPIWRWMSRQSG
jgi:hypothetical protein